MNTFWEKEPFLRMSSENLMRRSCCCAVQVVTGKRQNGESTQK